MSDMTDFICNSLKLHGLHPQASNQADSALSNWSQEITLDEEDGDLQKV